MEIPRGRGVSNAQFFQRKYDSKMEFPEEWGGSSKKTFLGRGMDYYFLEQHIPQSLMLRSLVLG